MFIISFGPVSKANSGLKLNSVLELSINFPDFLFILFLTRLCYYSNDDGYQVRSFGFGSSSV